MIDEKGSAPEPTNATLEGGVVVLWGAWWFKMENSK